MRYDINSFFAGYNSHKEVITDFCKTASNYLDCQYIIPVSNGTSAIEVALKSMGLKRGDFVIVPDISFIATATAVANCGLIPVYADVSPEYFGLTVETIDKRLTSSVKAVLLVHFSGYVNREIFEICEYCKKNDLLLLEDCAQAFACSANGIKVGTIGDAGTFSFQSSKIINSGEGGMISTNNSSLAAECEAIADWGLSSFYSSRKLDLASSNYRLSALQCIFLTEQIKEIEKIVASLLNLVACLEAGCSKLGIEIRAPQPKNDFFDTPFFLPVSSKSKINTIEPRDESPMHRSAIVPAIFKRFYPDLLEVYTRANLSEVFKCFESNRIIADVDFINLHDVKNKSVDLILSAYKEKGLSNG